MLDTLGLPWRQLPTAYGKRKSVYRWYDGAAKVSVCAHRQTDPDLSACGSGTARSCAERGGHAPKRCGARCWSGFRTQSYLLTDRRAVPCVCESSQCYDRPQPETWDSYGATLSDRRLDL